VQQCRPCYNSAVLELLERETKSNPLGREVADTFPWGTWPLWFDADAIVDCFANSLFAAEITLGGLHRNMSEQKLNLLQLSACRVAELCARAPQIVWSETRKASFWRHTT
jgi:hypothetical protein